MIQTGSSGGKLYANNDTIAVANTAQLLAAGAETNTFNVLDPNTGKATGIRWLGIMYASGDCWISKTEAGAAATAGGDEDDRIFIAATTAGLSIPWSGADVYFLNAVTGETPSIYVIGWY